jgi:SAM-dependent methyltransferase
VNVDINPRWKPDIVADCASMPMFADGSAELIVAHHQAEHMPLDGSKTFFTECHRILAPDASLLIFVPDLTALVKAWSESRISDYIFCVNLHGAFMGADADIHKWSFTARTLKEHLLKSAPWSEVKPFDWRKIPGADIAGPDFWILAIEAVK